MNKPINTIKQMIIEKFILDKKINLIHLMLSNMHNNCDLFALKHSFTCN